MAADDRTVEAIVSAETRAVAAEGRLRSQTMVLAEAEHRLKTALAVITGWAATLEDRWEQLDDGRRREGLGIIRRSAEGMADQAKQLLYDARAEILMLDLAPVEVDLREVLEVNVATFGGLSQTHAIVHKSPPQADVVIEIDPAALQQVLGHLLENAVKYSPSASTVVVAARRHEGEVVLEVADEGVGVPDDVDVFAPFQRGSDTRSEGVGLGLYIVRNLVRAMGGDVAATRNASGVGSTFTVRLPA